MTQPEKIKVAIVDDNKEFIESLVDHFLTFPEVTVIGSASHYKQARILLSNTELDLVFLDIEMPCKNGFELLNEMRQKGCSFKVIFYTAYDKYMIQALRESAFDYIIKPVDPTELKGVIERYKKQRAEQTPASLQHPSPGTAAIPDIMALPSNLGLRFVDKNRLLLFRCISGGGFLEKSCWEALLTDFSTIKLGSNTSADRINQLLKRDRFLQINQSCIINLNFLNIVEFKTRSCLLVPPYDSLKLTVSRSQLAKIRELYEVL
jgi:two-component system, LytTR family, response regulator